MKLNTIVILLLLAVFIADAASVEKRRRRHDPCAWKSREIARLRKTVTMLTKKLQEQKGEKEDEGGKGEEEKDEEKVNDEEKDEEKVNDEEKPKSLFQQAMHWVKHEAHLKHLMKNHLKKTVGLKPVEPLAKGIEATWTKNEVHNKWRNVALYREDLMRQHVGLKPKHPNRCPPDEKNFEQCGSKIFKCIKGKCVRRINRHRFRVRRRST